MRAFPYVSELRRKYHGVQGFVVYDGMAVAVRVAVVRRWGLVPRLRVEPVTGRGMSSDGSPPQRSTGHHGWRRGKPPSGPAHLGCAKGRLP
jgi:hypothetical protein